MTQATNYIRSYHLYSNQIREREEPFDGGVAGISLR